MINRRRRRRIESSEDGIEEVGSNPERPPCFLHIRIPDSK